ncbi:MAG: sulfotransferase [Bacteroidota bacterium]|nr:sulfotransferase [Bacteroidota bacterium]
MKSNIKFIIKYRIVILFIVRLFKIFNKGDKNFASPPFFILGSGRNGSTLLSSILNAHQDILIPPEQFILPYAIIKKYIYFFKSQNNWKNDVLGMFSDPNKTLNWNIAFKTFNIEAGSVASLFNNIYLLFAEQNNKKIKIWGDKTPINIHFIDFIYPEFKFSKYIFLIRDPRDVVLSYKKLDNHRAQDTQYAIWKWIDSVQQLEYLQKRTNVLLIKYEDLVLDPNMEVNKILNYLGFDDNNTLISSKTNAVNMGVGDKLHHKNLNKPINNNSIGKWKKHLSNNDVKLINRRCSKYLQEFGYPI